MGGGGGGGRGLLLGLSRCPKKVVFDEHSRSGGNTKSLGRSPT